MMNLQLKNSPSITTTARRRQKNTVSTLAMDDRHDPKQRHTLNCIVLYVMLRHVLLLYLFYYFILDAYCNVV